MARTILVKGDFDRREADAAAAVTPGMLLELTSTGDVQPHSAADGPAQNAFAFENEIFGQGIDTAYAAGDRCLYGIAGDGATINALVAAGAAAIAIGDYLSSAGDGTLHKYTQPAAYTQGQAGGEVIVGVAASAVDNSGGSTTARVLVEAM